MASESVPGAIVKHFGSLEDPRIDRAKRHGLMDIIVITLCGVVCGADNWVEIEEFGKAKGDWFAKFLNLPNGIPSHDTLGLVFGLLDPERFAECFTAWTGQVRELAQGEVVVIDGNTLRGCHDRFQGMGGLHTVSAWASENRPVLGQTRTSAHSNEITAIPELLSLLELRGCLITIEPWDARRTSPAR